MTEVDFKLPEEGVSFKVIDTPTSGVQVIPKLTHDDYALLEQFLSHPAWKLYVKLLKGQKEGHLLSLLPTENPHAALKKVGLIAGVNLAINLPEVYVAQYRQRLKDEAKRQEESKV